MNKRIIKLVTIVLAVLAAMQLGSFALADDYTYTVRIFAGNEGATINGETEYSFTANYGDDIDVTKMLSPRPGEVTNGGKYYVRGIRESGLDNNRVSNNQIHVTEDVDYVVAYGIAGELVSYTIYYVDEAGNDLADPQTYYGNVGDKPVAAYLYIDGYEPQAYNLTGTLSANEAENMWYFIYTPIVRPTPAPAPTPVVVTGDEEPDEPEDEEPEAPGEEEEVPEEEAPAAEEPGEEITEITEDETPLDNGPREIIDLDEEDTPLGESAPVEKEKTPLQQERETSRRNLYISGALLVAALAAIVTLAVMLLKKRGKNKT